MSFLLYINYNKQSKLTIVKNAIHKLIIYILKRGFEHVGTDMNMEDEQVSFELIVLFMKLFFCLTRKYIVYQAI